MNGKTSSLSNFLVMSNGIPNLILTSNLSQMSRVSFPFLLRFPFRSLPPGDCLCVHLHLRLITAENVWFLVEVNVEVWNSRGRVKDGLHCRWYRKKKYICVTGQSRTGPAACSFQERPEHWMWHCSNTNMTSQETADHTSTKPSY